MNEIKCEDQDCVPEEKHDEEGIEAGELFESKNISSVSTANASMAPIGGAEPLNEHFNPMDHEEHQETNCHDQGKNNEPWLDIDIRGLFRSFVLVPIQSMTKANSALDRIVWVIR